MTCGLSTLASGFLAGNGYIDFAGESIHYISFRSEPPLGSSVVHMVGGFSGLCAAFFLGPRSGRFVNGEVEHCVANILTRNA